jgi:hypothetical protein
MATDGEGKGSASSRAKEQGRIKEQEGPKLTVEGSPFVKVGSKKGPKKLELKVGPSVKAGCKKGSEFSISQYKHILFEMQSVNCGG